MHIACLANDLGPRTSPFDSIRSGKNFRCFWEGFVDLLEMACREAQQHTGHLW